VARGERSVLKILLGTLLALVLALWTGGTLLLSSLTQWVGTLLADGKLTSVGSALPQWPLPGWLEAWVDPVWWEQAQRSAVGLLASFGDLLPWLGAAVGWLVPLIWIGWALGVVLLLLLGGAGWLLIGRAEPRPA